VWRALTMPLALPLRLRVLAGSRSEAPVLVERQTLR
jgi:hypothetical protein